MAHRELTGVLLVGGASRRFGTPKALARLDGEPLAERAWRLLGEACDERLAVGKHADSLELPFPLLDDGTDVRAPIAGLVAGLRAAANDLVVAIAVDTPLLRREDLHALAAACADAAAPPSGPLPGAYRKTALPVLDRRLAAGQLALRDALADFDARVVELPPARLVNVNTAAELAELESPPIVPLAPEHHEAFRTVVADGLAEFGFTEVPDLDGDLLDPQSAYAAAWVAVERGEVVGSVALQELGDGEVLLKRMYLREAMRGRGLGRRLLTVALGWARGAGYERVLLDTSEEMTTARRLYESAGFRRVERTDERQGFCRVYYRLDL